jgi:hypothetical protein
LFQVIDDKDYVATEPDWNLDGEEEGSNLLNFETMIKPIKIDTMNLANGSQQNSSIA